MARLGSTFNPSEHEAHKPHDPLPAGWYAMKIVSSETKQTNDHTGAYLKIDLEIDEQFHAEYRGRRAWDRLNLWNRNPDAVRIANGKLKTICVAVGWDKPLDDTELIHGKTLAVKLKVRPADGQYEATNEVTGYDSVAARFPGGAVVASQQLTPPPMGAPAPTPSMPQQAPSAAPQSPGGAPPWGGPAGG